MNARSTLLLCCAAGIVLTLTTSSDAARYYVRKSGNDRQSGTSRSKAWSSLSRLSKQPLAPGDIVYIGAGLYSDAFAPRSVPASGRGSVRIIGDTTGRITGDRGPVVFVPNARRWQATFTNTGAFRFDNITFDSRTPTVGRQGYGIYSPRGNATLTFVNCVFQQLRYAAFSTAAPLSFQNCRFVANTTGDVLVRGSSTARLRSCVFDHTRGNGSGVLVSQQGSVTIERCRFTKGTFGVYSNGDTMVSVSDSVYQSVRYPVYGRCRTGDVSRSVIVTATTGIYLQATSEPTRIENVQLRSANIGLQVPQAGYQLSRVTLVRNRVAVWIHPLLKRFDVRSQTRLILQGNQYGIYLPRHANAVGTTVSLRGMTFAGHTQYAVLTYGARLSVRDCSFRSNRYGVYSTDSRSCEIRNTPFERHGAGWAVVAAGNGIDIRDCSLTSNRNTIYLRPARGATPSLRNLAVSGSRIGIRVDGGQVRVPKSSKVSMTGTATGWLLINCDSELAGVSLTGGSLGVDIRGGKSVLNDVSVTGSGYGVIARNVQSLNVTNLKSQRNRNWGLYASGRVLRVSGAVIDGNRNGVYLQETGSDGVVPITDTQVTNNRGYGLFMTRCTLAEAPRMNLALRGNRGSGLVVVGQPVTIKSEGLVDISGNGTGIQAVDSNVTLSQVTLADNGFGVRSTRGDVVCTDTSITGGSYGIYQVHGRKCVLTGTTISKARRYGLVTSSPTVAGANTQLANVQITGCGTAAYVNNRNGSTLSVSGCTFSGSSAHGLLAYRAATVIDKSTFSSNRAYGVIHIDGPLTISNSTVENNRSYGVRVYSQRNARATVLTANKNHMHGNLVGFGTLRADSSNIANNLISGNRYGVISHTTGTSAEIWNNTLADNQIGIYHTAGRSRVKNNIISYGDLTDADRAAWGIYFGAGEMDHSHNLLFGQTRKYLRVRSGTGDVIKPPRFRNRATGDFRLASGSPAINAGIPGGSIVDDVNGLSRPLHGATEIGAHEFPERAGSVRILDWQELAAGGS